MSDSLNQLFINSDAEVLNDLSIIDPNNSISHSKILRIESYSTYLLLSSYTSVKNRFSIIQLYADSNFPNKIAVLANKSLILDDRKKKENLVLVELSKTNNHWKIISIKQAPKQIYQSKNWTTRGGLPVDKDSPHGIQIINKVKDKLILFQNFLDSLKGVKDISKAEQLINDGLSTFFNHNTHVQLKNVQEEELSNYTARAYLNRLFRLDYYKIYIPVENYIIQDIFQLPNHQYLIHFYIYESGKAGQFEKFQKSSLHKEGEIIASIMITYINEEYEKLIFDSFTVINFKN